jgi:ATP/maltotriose-dependent transcriptional regulator MalT
MTEHTAVVSAQIFALAHTGAAQTRLGELRRARRHLLQAARLCRDHPVIFPVAALLASAAVLLEQCGDHGSATSFARLACARPDADFHVRHVGQTVLERAADVLDNPSAETVRYALELNDHDDLAVLFERLDNLDVDSIARPALTHREREVLELLIRGASNLQIARRLGVAEGTVKRYTHHLFAKLGVQNRAEAVYRSTQWNLL